VRSGGFKSDKNALAGGPICSLDVHPRGEPKLLTAGTNEKERGIVVLWNTRLVRVCVDDGNDKRIRHTDESYIYARMEFDGRGDFREISF
jgi:hypothetical protein